MDSSSSESSDSDLVSETPRYFKAKCDKVNESKYFGRFRGYTPKDAANRAYNSICRKFNTEHGFVPKEEVKFMMKECTRGSKEEVFRFIGLQKKMENPYTFNFKNGRSCTLTRVGSVKKDNEK